MSKHFLTSLLLVLFMASCGKPSPFEGKMRESLRTSLGWRNDTTGMINTEIYQIEDGSGERLRPGVRDRGL